MECHLEESNTDPSSYLYRAESENNGLSVLNKRKIRTRYNIMDDYDFLPFPNRSNTNAILLFVPPY